MLYDTFQNRTIIHGKLVAVDPLHIGSSGKETLNPIDVDNSVLKDAKGDPLIPGSSIKGVVRSRFEAVMRSIGENVCDVFAQEDENICVTNQSLRNIENDKERTRAEKAQEMYGKSCVVCQLFGGKAVAGKIRFKDCTYLGEKPCEIERRDGVGIDRETGAAKCGAKYDFEIIPKGTEFDFSMIAENLDEQQQRYLKLILRMLQGNLLGEDAEDYLAVGGKTTRGLGRIRLEEITTETITAQELKQKMQEKFGI